MGWTSIYQLFWCSPGVQGFDTLPYIFFGGAFCKTYLHPSLGGCWEGSFWTGVKIPNFITISGFEGTLHLTYTPVSNFKTSQLPKNKAPLSNFASNLSGSTTQLLTSSHILSHSQKVSLPIFLCEDADFLYCLWIILPFYFVDPPTLEPCGGLRDPRAASQTLPRWRVAGAAGAFFFK